MPRRSLFHDWDAGMNQLREAGILAGMQAEQVRREQAAAKESLATHARIARAEAEGGLIPGVDYTSTYWDTAQGQQELNQRHNDMLAQQMQDMRDGLERESQYVQIGSHVFSPKEREQRQEIAQASLDALDSMAPMVGVLGPEAVRGALGQVAADTISEQRNLRKASREFDMIFKLGRNGTHSTTQTANAMEKLREEYGDSLLQRLPQYAEMVGIEQQLEDARSTTMDRFAKTQGWDRKYVTWDSKNDAPTVNTEAISAEMAIITIQERKASMANKATKDLIQAVNVKTQSIDKQMATVSKAIANREAQGLDASGLYKQHYNLAAAQMQNQKQLDAVLGVNPQPQRQGPLTPVPRTFNTRAEAAAAARSGQIAKDEKVMIEGVPSSFNGSQFRKVP